MVRGLSVPAGALLLFATACQSQLTRDPFLDWPLMQDPQWTAPAEKRGYWAARLQDLLDVLPISFGAGTGVYVGARVPMLGAGLGWTEEVDRYGWATAPVRATRAGSWRETGQLGLLFSMSRCSAEGGYDLACVPIGPFENQDGSGGMLWTMWADVEAEVHLGFIGVRLGFSLMQFLDLFTSAFGWDMVGDDQPSRSKTMVRAWRANPDAGVPR